MRSFTTDDLPGRCRTCWVRVEHCICADLPRVEARSGVVVVRHDREAAKSTGTARVASLALPRSRLVGFGDDPQEANAKLAGLTGHLLFPAEPQAPWPTGPVENLVVLDGTWRQTRRMLKKLPALQGLPRLWLPPKETAVLRLRESAVEGGRSTLEAIADALAILEGEAVAAPLHRLHALYVERVFRARGVWEQKRRAHAT